VRAVVGRSQRRWLGSFQTTQCRTSIRYRFAAARENEASGPGRAGA
jgi:hypothetical protein